MRLIALDSPEICIRKTLITKTRDQNPLDRTRLPFQLVATIFVLGLPKLGFDRITLFHEWFEDVGKTLPLVTNRISDARHVLPIGMVRTPNHLRLTFREIRQLDNRKKH